MICAPSAGRLWELRRINDTRLHVAVPYGSNPFAAGAVVHRTAMPQQDVVIRPDGIRLTSPPRTLFDLAASLDPLRLESVIEQVLDRGWTTVPTLHAVARRLAAPGPCWDRAGSAPVLASRPAYLRPADSDLEVRVFDASAPSRAHPARASAHPAASRRQDHPARHRRRRPRRWGDRDRPRHVARRTRPTPSSDKARDRACRRLGWQIDRVTDDEVEHDLSAVVGELVALADRRRRELGLTPAA